MIERALKQRRNMPMFLVDLAVPRDIEPEVNELGDAYLYTVDDLQQIVEQNMASRELAAQEAEKLVESQVNSYLTWQQSRKSIDLVKQFRERGEAQRDELVEKALNQLAEGKSPEAAIQELAYKLTNSIMHGPTRALRKAATETNGDTAKLLADAMELALPPADSAEKHSE